MKPPHKELIADGNRQKPPRAKSVPSTTSSDALTLLGDIDDEITTSASESYPQEESSSNEGNFKPLMMNQSRIFDEFTVSHFQWIKI